MNSTLFDVRDRFDPGMRHEMERELRNAFADAISQDPCPTSAVTRLLYAIAWFSAHHREFDAAECVRFCMACGFEVGTRANGGGS